MPRRRATIELAPIVAGLTAGTGDEVTEAVLDAAGELLRAYGLRRWSVDDVADRAGLGRTTVYRKFSSRDEIVHAVLARELRHTFALVASAAAAHTGVEAKLVAGGVAALHALDGSIVDSVLRSDPETFLPFLTTKAGPLLAIARGILAPQILAAGVASERAHAEELAEAVARLALSFVLTRETILPLDEASLSAAVRRLRLFSARSR